MKVSEGECSETLEDIDPALELLLSSQSTALPKGQLQIFLFHFKVLKQEKILFSNGFVLRLGTGIVVSPLTSH